MTDLVVMVYPLVCVWGTRMTLGGLVVMVYPPLGVVVRDLRRFGISVPLGVTGYFMFLLL